MSKSYNNTIPLFSSRDQLKKLIGSLLTDSRALANPRTPKALRCSRSTRPLPPLKKPKPCAAPMPRALPGAMPSKCCWSGWTR